MARSKPNQRPIVVVTEGGSHIWAIVNAVADQLGPVSVVLEAPESKSNCFSDGRDGKAGPRPSVNSAR